MTLKQEQILNTALVLFSREGYHATSTKKIAKVAKVSEGLIFRHFKNKEGLVEAILQEGEERAKQVLLPILTEEDPKQVIRKILESPFNIKESEFDFWKLQFKLKWELNQDNRKKMRPLKNKLIEAFKQLRYKEPLLEAEFLIQYLDGISAAILKGGLPNESVMKAFLIKKYHINQ